MAGDNLNKPQVSMAGVLGPGSQVQSAMSKLNQIAGGNADAIDKLLQGQALNNLVDNSKTSSQLRNSDVPAADELQQRQTSVYVR